MGFSRQEYWSGLPFPSPGELPDPGIEPRSPALQADALTSEPPGKPTLQQENRLNEKPRHRNEQRPFTATRKSESEVAQSCPTLCNAMDCSLPHFFVHGISQARVLEWVAISFPRGCSQSRDQAWVSCIASRIFTLWATREAQCNYTPIKIFKRGGGAAPTSQPCCKH